MDAVIEAPPLAEILEVGGMVPVSQEGFLESPLQQPCMLKGPLISVGMSLSAGPGPLNGTDRNREEAMQVARISVARPPTQNP